MIEDVIEAIIKSQQNNVDCVEGFISVLESARDQGFDSVSDLIDALKSE